MTLRSVGLLAFDPDHSRNCGGAIYSIYSGIEPEASPLGIAAAIVAVIIMPILWTQKMRIGSEGNILPLTVDAIESAACFFMSIALLGGLLVNFLLHVAWADYIATAIILGFVALEIKESIGEIRR